MLTFKDAPREGGGGGGSGGTIIYRPLTPTLAPTTAAPAADNSLGGGRGVQAMPTPAGATDIPATVHAPIGVAQPPLNDVIVASGAVLQSSDPFSGGGVLANTVAASVDVSPSISLSNVTSDTPWPWSTWLLIAVGVYILWRNL